MPLKSNPKYKIDRRRTPRERSATELSDSEEDSATSGNDSEEYSSEDNEDDGNFKTPRKRRPPRKVNNPKSKQHRKINDEEFNDESSEEEDVKPEAPSTRKSPRRSTTVSSTRARRKSHRGEVGDVLANLPTVGRKLSSEMAAEDNHHDDSEEEVDEDDPSDNENDGDSDYNDSGDENDDDDDGDDDDEEDEEEDEEEKDKEIDELLQNRSRARSRRNSTRAIPKRAKRKRATHSSDEEFVVDSDDDDGDDSSQDLSTGDDASAKLTEEDEPIFGDPDLSEDDSEVVVTKRKGKKDGKTNALIRDGDDNGGGVVNVDNEQIGIFDDESDSDGPDDEKASTKSLRSAENNEILPSPKGSEAMFEEKPKAAERLKRKPVCPKCPSTEDAVTLEPLTRVHVCYIAPDGKSRVCFNLQTLRHIALKSSQLALRVDIDATRKNFLQPPAFRTPMSDDLVDQIASKFGRGALDLEGPYYRNREAKYDRKDTEDDDYSFDSNSSDMENIYDSFETFQERVKNYFRNGMGSQDLYVCPLCYGKIHRSVGQNRAAPHNKESDSGEDDDTAAAIEEYDAAPSDSVYDPITVLGYLDNDEMTMASQFCFKRIADVKRHLREDHNVDIRGIQGNELYMRFRVRAPDGLLQRWLSTQVRGQVVKQGHMRMYWGDGNDQIFIQLLDLMERVRAHAEGSPSDHSDDSSEEDGGGGELDRYAIKAQKFFDTFASKAHHWWKLLSSPFLKSNENLNDFIAEDDEEYYSEEEDSGGQQQHAAIHQQFMNEDSDENDLVHKLQRKYAEPNDEESASGSSSTEEELEIVHKDEESDDEGDGYGRNGYYSPIEEEKDEWMLDKLQSQRKRKEASAKKEKSTSDKLKTPTTGKKLFRRKTPTPSVAASSTKRTSSSKKKRILTLDDSSDED